MAILKKTITQQIKISGIEMLLTQKKMRSISIRVVLPDAEVRVSASTRYSFSQIEAFVLSKIEWIKKSRAHILKLRDQGKIKLPLKLISGDEIEFFNQKLQLEVVKNSSKNAILINPENPSQLIMTVKDQSNFKQRQKLLDDFYRKNLTPLIPQFIKKYEEKMNVKVAEFKIKKMKTRWGTCNVRKRRIWLNLELAKKSFDFLESIIVHEMVHLLEASHNKRFYELMDYFMPEWRMQKL